MRLRRANPIDGHECQDFRGSNVGTSDTLELQVLAAFQRACAVSDLEVAEGLLNVLEIIDRRQNERARMGSDDIN